MAIHNKGVDCHESSLLQSLDAGFASKSRNDKSDYTIAFEFMETFIKAVEKEVIKSVVLWKQKRLNATKAIVENHH